MVEDGAVKADEAVVAAVAEVDEEVVLGTTSPLLPLPPKVLKKPKQKSVRRGSGASNPMAVHTQAPGAPTLLLPWPGAKVPKSKKSMETRPNVHIYCSFVLVEPTIAVIFE